MADRYSEPTIWNTVEKVGFFLFIFIAPPIGIGAFFWFLYHVGVWLVSGGTNA